MGRLSALGFEDSGSGKILIWVSDKVLQGNVIINTLHL